MGIIKDSLTFDDVTLIPGYSAVLPSETITSVKLTSNLMLKLTSKNFRDLKDWKNMYNKVAKKATTNCKDVDEFVKILEKVFGSGKPWEANSKLMQMHFLSQVLDITDKTKYTEFWTDMVFLSIKKGDRFGPFGKLY